MSKSRHIGTLVVGMVGGALLALAACNGPAPAMADPPSGGSGGSGGATGTGGMCDCTPPEPEYVTEACKPFVKFGITHYAAEHVYPDLSVEELRARVTAFGLLDSPMANAPDGADSMPAPMFFADGKVWAICDGQFAGPAFGNVQFILR